MSFRHDDRVSIFGALRPAAGQVVTRAVVTTYSLDLVALLGLVLTLGGDGEAEYETSPLGLVRAFDTMRGRLAVLHQLGRIVAPARHRSILPLLDTMVHAIPANESSESWHPKTALVRYEREGKAEWRFWIGSRNLTGSTDLDAGLLLCTSKSRSSKPITDVAELASDLLREAGLTSAELSEIRAARWSAPDGVTVKELRWRRPGDIRRFLPDPLIGRADRACAVSPFIDRHGLGEVLAAGAKRVALLTTESAGAACAPLPGVDFHTHTLPPIQRRRSRSSSSRKETKGSSSSRHPPGSTPSWWRSRRARGRRSCWGVPTLRGEG